MREFRGGVMEPLIKGDEAADSVVEFYKAEKKIRDWG